MYLKKGLVFCALSVCIGLVAAAHVYGSELVNDPGKGKDIRAAKNSQLVDGRLLKIDGEYYILMDKAGKEVRVQVDSETQKMSGAKRSGDMIQAEVTDGGRAIAIQ